MTLATVRLWGSDIGAVSLEDGKAHASFQYDPAFLRSGIELSPLALPLSSSVYTFPELSLESFHGLPGLLADSLPDRFGNALINAWLAMQGRTPESFNAVERLCYTGTRGMGALEYVPSRGPRPQRVNRIDVDALVNLASAVLGARADLKASFSTDKRKAALQDILRVGTSAGGARAKAVIAWNPVTNEVRSGQVTAGPGFGCWLLKFDGVAGNRDKELADPTGFGTIEYAYSLMATSAGIRMGDCRLLEENGRRHFMSRRFDRLENGGKLHMLSLGGLAHFDYNMTGAHAYEEALLTIRRLDLRMEDVEEQFRRMAFNVIACNRDDHVKNIAFLMDRNGAWSLSPAFDLTYSHNPHGMWTATHQMTMNGKRDGFTLEDFRACARSASMKRGRAESIISQVRDSVMQWPDCAARAGVNDAWTDRIQADFRLEFQRS
jgi:serine/threonine-protein kinase HipA